MKTAQFLKKDLTTSQDLSAGALSYTSSTGRKFKLEEVLIHFSVAVTETVTLTRDSVNGVNYDAVLDKGYLVAEQDYVFRPQGECNFWEGDEIKVQCTNANLTGVAYLVIKRSEL
ncbi:MAG: hypothetical protein ABIG52_00055 [Nanoarchaeota archaeon]